MFPSMATFEMAINHHVSTVPNTNQINIEPPTENIPYVRFCLVYDAWFGGFANPFGTESASRMHSQLNMSWMTSNCCELLSAHVCKLSPRWVNNNHPTSVSSFAALLLSLLRTLVSPCSHFYWSICACETASTLLPMMRILCPILMTNTCGVVWKLCFSHCQNPSKFLQLICRCVGWSSRWLSIV